MSNSGGGGNIGGRTLFADQLFKLWNSEDDFVPLHIAGRSVNKCLREDESSPHSDLYRKLSAVGPGAHSYFADTSAQSTSNALSTLVTKTSSATQEGIRRGPHSPYGGGQEDENNDNTNNNWNQFRRNSPGGTTSQSIGRPTFQSGQHQHNVDTITVAPPVQTLKHVRSVPIPSFLIEKQKNVQIASFMGLLTNAGLAYMTVDATIYLWSIVTSSSSTSSSICSFTVPSMECIVSIGLVRPKPGIFRKDKVHWCLVITTASEVLLCALSFRTHIQRQSQSSSSSLNHSDGTSLRLVPTKYKMSTDNVRMHSVVGTESGRIFLGGEDGSLYEMTYDGANTTTSSSTNAAGQAVQMPISVQEQLDLFYDHNEVLPNVIVANHDDLVTDAMPSLAKRAWDTIASGLSDVAIIPMPSTDVPMPNQKCRKINRTSTPSSTVLSNVVPEFVVRGLSYLLGGRKISTTTGGKIVQIVVDEDRETLYTLSSNGHICSFDLRNVNHVPSLRLAAIIDTIRTAKTYLEVVQRGQIPASSPPSYSNEGNIIFPGGSTAAAINVGDKEGARLILKLEKEALESHISSLGSSYSNGGSNSWNGRVSSSTLRPTSLHIIPPTESSRLTLLAVCPVGIRLYISALSPQVISQGPGSSYGGGGGRRLTTNKSRRLNTRNSIGVSSNSNRMPPLAPYRFMTLCSIRAPPLITGRGQLAFSGSSGHSHVEGGFAPAVANNNDNNSSSTSPHHLLPLSTHVSACVYDQGLFLAAVQDTRYSNSSHHYTNLNSNNKNNSSSVQPKDGKAAGDMIVAICPDIVKRKVLSSTANVGAGARSLLPTGNVSNDDFSSLYQTMIVPGGISERVTFPINTAFSNGGTEGTPMLLPGGKVLDIAIVSTDAKNHTPADILPVLASYSRTPTDSELGVGVPPRFYPTKNLQETRPRNGLAGNGMNSGNKSNSQELVTVGNTPFKIMSTLLTNILFSRRLSYGLTTNDGSSSGQRKLHHHGRTHQLKLYRISKRDATRGFSPTAEETFSTIRSSNTSSDNLKSTGDSLTNGSSNDDRANSTILTSMSKSARLRPWLLQPDPVPLNDVVVQYYSQKKEVVMLNAGGLHYFEYEALSSKLADSIYTARENIRTNSTITSFFANYGYEEGCAMCFGIAIGSLPFGYVSANEELANRAIEAALLRAFVPKLLLLDNIGSSIVSSITSNEDPLVPLSYEFRPSALCDSLHILFSRLVRPFWHKPAAVVTEGRVIKVQWTNDVRLTPAKVELLLDEAVMEKICLPLRALLDRMRNVFRRVIMVVPGSFSRQQKGGEMDIDNDESFREQHITRFLHFQNQIQNQQSALNQHLLPEADADLIARQIEDKNIHCLYRLLARTVQLLELMSLIRRAQSMPEIREVDWGQLHGLTYCQLAQSSEGQDRLEGLLNGLVTAYASSRSSSDQIEQSAPSANMTQVDDLAHLFATRCYLYFSPGSRLAYLGLRRGEEALRHAPQSSERLSLANQAAHFFREASKHWHSAPLVTGRILHQAEKASFYHVALLAMESHSPLALAVRLLMNLEDVVAIVDICLTTASNFKVSVSMADSSAIELYTKSSTNELSWEKNLYHKRKMQVQTDNIRIGRNVMGQSPSSVISYGTEVTAQDAIDTCFSLIFQCLSSLLNAKSNLADRMISSCASAEHDDMFMKEFFSFLLDNDYADTLLRIDSPKLDEWLKSKNDSDLLCRYYSIQGRPEESGKVAYHQACNPNSSMLLDQRIYYLSRSLASYKKARDEAQRSRSDEQSARLTQTITEIEETLQVAIFQSRILKVVESDQNMRSKLSDVTFKLLQFTLTDVTTLYNNYAAKLELYDDCLRLLHACHQNDPETIQYLWIIIFSDELLPCTTRSESIYERLQDFFENRFNQSIKLILSNMENGSIKFYDNGEWESSLVTRIKLLGKDLYKPGMDYVFPVPFLLKKLYELRETIPSVLPPSWPLQIMAEVGVPYLEILDIFDNIVHHYGGHIIAQDTDQVRFLSYMQATTDLMMSWISLARSENDSKNSSYAKKQLFQALGNGTLMSKIDAMKSQIITHPDDFGLLDRIRGLEEDVRMIM